MTTSSEPPKAPRGLKTAGKRFWRAAVEEYDLTPQQLELLTQAAELLDRAGQAAAELRRAGLTFEDRFGQVRTHPAVEVERLSRLAFVRICKVIGLHQGALTEG